MALTNEEKQELLNAIKAESQSVDELEQVESLDNINSLPAMRGNEVVAAPVALLRKPAEDAAKTANAAASTASAAAEKASTAAQQATAAKEAADAAAEKATTAAENTEEAIAGAKAAAELYANTTGLALNGATARFDSIDESEVVNIEQSGTTVSDGVVVWSVLHKAFLLRQAGKYYNSWSGSGATVQSLFTDGLHVLKNKIFVCDSALYVWSDEEGDLVEISGSGGGNTLNVTSLYPLPDSYHTLATAIASVEEKLRSKGRCITFESAQGKWTTKQFVGTSLATWEQEASWEDFGGGGTIKSLHINGKVQTPDEEGNINIQVNDIDVDESLDAESTNPVQNSAVTAKLNEVDRNTVFGMSAELSDDESTVHLALTNKQGGEIASADIPAGSGGGGGESSTTRIVLSASVDKTTIKEGSNVQLTYSYDHQNASGDSKGESTGQKATIQVSIRRGSTTTYSETTQEVSRGTYTLDLTKYLLLGTSDIYVVAETTDPTTGKTQRKQSYVSVKVVTLSLESSFNLASALSSGGYSAYDTVSIPYTVSGTGTKTVFLYLDGRQLNAETITRSGTTNGNFNVSMTGLSIGRHTIQMVAEMEAGDELTLKSESIHIDILKAGNDTPFVGFMLTHADGHIETNETHLEPTITIGQYESCEFKFVAYDPQNIPASMSIARDGNVFQTMSVPRSTQVLSNRFTEKGEQTMTFKVGSTSSSLHIMVEDSGVEMSEATYGLVAKLSPDGRSNGENNPAVWESNGVKTTFEGFDWSSNGWTGNSLKLSNGAKAVIDYPLFKTDAGTNGLTIEMELKVSNVVDRDANIISCMSDYDKDGVGKGLSVTASEASIKTGTIITYTNEDGDEVQREIKIGTNYAADQWLKVAFVIGKRTEGRLMELYVNGNRASADIYDNSYFFVQNNPVGITLESEAADLEVKNLRIYNRGLSDDEVLENYMVDQDTTDAMMQLYDKNDIMGETGDVDIDKLRDQGKGVMRIVRAGGMAPIYETNNKKTDFEADIYFYSPFGADYDFVLKNCYIRIQGTSSTKYPSKNIRIYLSKGGQELSLTVGGVLQESLKYKMRPGAIAMNLFCMKSDYSDSSMTMNTGVAKLFNDVMKELGLLTPPQRYQYEQGGESLNAITVRTAIDGFPIDIFAAETVDGENTYQGQYNFNNEKSKSGKLFGMESFDDFTVACGLTLETLNNGEKVCLFQSSSDEDLAQNFDAGLETNVPDDVKWAGLDEQQQAALKRLYGWIRACVPDGADANDLSTFRSEKFMNEVGQYFDLNWLLTYYIHTDYFGEVDQRAKNMLLRTWDGLIWYITYYDGDCQIGKRNDCFLVYAYTMDRDTWDEEKDKYAFEGRESWLWNLVLANMGDELKAAAAAYRAKMTLTRVLNMLDGEQMGNWSDRAYNKSGYLKYIKPAMVETYGKTWPYIYALQGSNAAHRRYWLTNRFALLDAKYGTNDFTSDNVDFYLNRSASDVADVFRMTAGEVYAFGYGTNNQPNLGNTGIVAADEEAELSISGTYTVNDPLRLYGASRMKVLDMTGAADHLKNGLDLAKCSVLRELNLESSTSGSTGWWLSLSSCKQLRVVNLRNQNQAKTGSTTSTELDFSNQTKLQKLDARGTSVQSVTFAKGAPVTTAKLPSSLTVLKLEYLNKLTDSGLSLEGYSNVNTLIVDSCPGISWETLLSRCSNVSRLRITGIDREDDGTWLNRFLKMGGVDADGNATDTCSLVGTVRLTTYLEAEEYETLCAHFPELNIKQPEYTMIEFDDSVSDDANITNLDNGTGYKSGTTYQMSGHISAIFEQRHRVLAKVTKKATTRNVTMAGVSTFVNNLDGEMTYFPLDDTNSYKYADGTDAKLDGTEGDWMMYEPFYWSKGVNDYLNQRHYACYCSNDKDHEPSRPDADVLSLEDIKAISGGYTANRKILSGKDTLASSFSNDTSYSVCKVDVSKHKRVRFPSVPGSNLVGSIFTDAEGNIVETVVVPTLSSRFEAGMYLISEVPSGATSLYFSILNTAEFDCVVLSNSNKIEDMEPDWVANDEHLCAIVGSSTVGSKLRAAITGGSTTASMPWTDFHYYSVVRGMQQIDALMHSRIANLFYAKYGRRDSQSQCGAGQHTNSRVTGGTASRGMVETIGYDEAKSIKDNVTRSLGDGVIPQYAWYKAEDTYGQPTVVQVNNTCCLGYEDIYNHKYDMMDNVDLPNNSGNTGKWRIWMPDGTTRMVKGTTTSDFWIVGVAHGKYMDVIAVGSAQGTSSTYYCDRYYISTAASRVVYRGCSGAYASGGVSGANAGSDASSSSTSVGSRLAFRGQIVKAQSAAAYKALTEIA